MSKLFQIAALGSGVAAAFLADFGEQAVGSKPTWNAEEFASFIDRWEQYQTRKLQENSRYLERQLQDNIKNPSYTVVNGAKILRDPMRAALSTPRMNSMRTPAINMFESHIAGTNGALLGDMDPEGARLRVWLDDAQVSAEWYLFPVKLEGTLYPSPRFIDRIIYTNLRERMNPRTLASLAESAKNSGIPSVGNADGWNYATRFLRYSDNSCISCHVTKKVGDLAGVMVYAARPKE